MTREEAKRRMEICRDFLANNYSDMGEPNFTAFNMAIKALSQECVGSTQKHVGNTLDMRCDDAISREDVLAEITRFSTEEGASVECQQLYCDVNNMPSVTQKSGKCIMSDDGLYRPICDKCGAHPWKGYIPTVEEATEVFKYCPNCGAKMESEDKE